MTTIRTGHMNVVINGDAVACPVINQYEHDDAHFFEADDGKEKTQILIYLPFGITSGKYDLGLNLGVPMVVHVKNQTSEAVVFPGEMELTVGGDAQFAGTFNGTDENGISVENGSLKFDHPA